MDVAAKIASDGFLELGSWREDDIQRYVDFVVPAMENQKKTIANYTTGYYQQIAGLSKEKFNIPDISAQLLSTEALRNGSTAQMIWERPFKEMWRQLKKGQDFSTALNAGALRAASTAKTEMQLAKRGAGFYARSANDRIIGYIRTLSGSENCALCYVASTQRYTRGDLLPIHPGCDCGELPIYGTKDIGQVIDEENLEKTHEAIAERFGISDRGAREPDYRKIMIHDHTELGPYLGVKGQKFTKVSKAKLNKPLKAPKPVPASAQITFAERIKPSLSKVNGTNIGAIIREDFREQLDKPGLLRKDITPTDKSLAALNQVKEIGKQADDELQKRVKARVKEIDTPEALDKIASKQIAIDSQIIDVSREIAGYRATVEARLLAEYTARFGDSEELAQTLRAKARYDAYTVLKKDKAAKALEAKFKALKAEKTKLARAGAEVVPGSLRYAEIEAEEALKLIKEVRETGVGGPKFTGSKFANNVLEQARQVYPSDWLATAAAKYPTVKTGKVQRGAWRPDGRLTISESAKGIGETGYSTAVHEMGHMFEDSVEGLKALEWVYLQERKKLNPTIQPLVGGGNAITDEWRQLYSGRQDYGIGPSANYEVFTTGVESLLGGSDYFGSVLKKQTIDDDFRQFILGVLLSL